MTDTLHYELTLFTKVHYCWLDGAVAACCLRSEQEETKGKACYDAADTNIYFLM